MQAVISDRIFGGSMTHGSRIPVPLSPPLPPQKTWFPNSCAPFPSSSPSEDGSVVKPSKIFFHKFCFFT